MSQVRIFTIDNLKALQLYDDFKDLYNKCTERARQGIEYINQHKKYIRYKLFCNDEEIFGDEMFGPVIFSSDIWQEDDELAAELWWTGVQHLSDGYLQLQDWYRGQVKMVIEKLLSMPTTMNIDSFIHFMHYPDEFIRVDLQRIGMYDAVINEVSIMSFDDFLTNLEESVYGALHVTFTTKNRSQSEIMQMADEQMMTWEKQIELVSSLNMRDIQYLDETKLHALGYRVGRSGDSQEIRQKFLESLIRTCTLNKQSIIATITNNINLHKHNPKMTQAVIDWETDLQYIKNLIIR